ncbi:transcription-repair coupling factor [uncultured Candidatus Puniceispirillum sp.]|uniref:transcription-repair coupling factor n=1 Tax=uncultured Candidatus Puniceispirillum sp. TaxID=1985115 RepID=UPI0032B1CE77
MNFLNKIDLDSSLWGCPDGAHMLAVATLAEANGRILYVARDDARLALMRDALVRLAPSLNILVFPAWDCLPYDRLSPQGALVGQRIEALARLASSQAELTENTIVLTTVNAFLQRVPPQSYFAESSLHITVGQTIEPSVLATFLVNNAYLRTDTVRETGEFAVRGGIVDVFPPGHSNPIRLDFFGDEIETMRSFDASSQRSIDKVESLTLHPVAEFRLDSQTVERFRTSYLAQFGATASRDALYESVSAERMHPGIEHWLPLFHPEMSRLTDYCPDWPIILDHEAQAASAARFEQIADFYEARADNGDDGSSPYRPLDNKALYLGADELERLSAEQRVCSLQRFAAPDGGGKHVDAGGRPGLTFPSALASGQSAVVEAVEAMRAEQAGQRRPIVIAAASEGAAVRLDELISEQMGAGCVARINRLDSAKVGGIHIIIWSLDAGFQSDNILVIAEADIFGQRLSRPQSKRGKGDDFLREVSALETGDLVVHAEHGIGRYDGLVTINSAGGDHDCLHLVYNGGDKLYLPVENIELLSRYGSGGGDSQLDKLGGVAWQARVARIKGRVRIMAEQLIKIAAQRHTANAEPLVATDGLFAEFCDRFSFVETDDQLNAIQDVVDDLASGKASDRLICGDVGFGKTEVALRAAFIVAMAGYQVALVAPTTLLARQHGKQFAERFAGFPLKLGVLSRMTSPSDAKQIKEDLASGDVQVVIGTHALLAKSLSFNNLGLLIVDEEQHFGVGQKERLKEMRGDIHVLTLSATPIPRTLQMALSGVREMSLIATPPVDRLAVRTFVGPWDGVVLREAILRETFRGGQIFVVCPRIDDLQRVYDRVRKLVPDARILSAHGRMPAAELDDVMTKFADGEADILLSTNIVESGIDIPSANTMIIHRADMFGLSQLYQLRGRVGRGRQRAYAYLTSDPNRILTPQARRRLEVMQTLDTLGAGFTLASYDMDIRGAGNLLGDEQSGHVREVGVELYQEMLRQAVDAAKAGDDQEGENTVIEWTPQINLGLEVRIPEAYVPDLTVRLSLYRRIAGLNDMSDIDAILAELVDRFGAMPDSVRNLFAVIELKQLCKLSNVEKIDAGPKGLSIGFRDNIFANPEQLVGWIAAQQGRVQLRGNHKLIIKQTLPQASGRAPVCKGIVQELVALL